MDFEEAYAKFCAEGRLKFYSKSENYPHDDIVFHGVRSLPLENLRKKFYEEVFELAKSNLEDSKEAIDVHNQAFLLWWYQQED